MPRLLVEKGPDRGKTFTLTAGQSFVVGRDAAVPVSIADPMASRKHAVLGERRGQWLIKDLSSANGTIVNGKPLESGKVTRISDGETFQIGDTLFTFSLGTELNDDPLLGQVIGGYRIDKRLGRGAMGTVYQAHQLSLGRDVALKMLAQDLVEDEKFTSMFVKEARAAAALNHPNILQVYDVGEADGHFFMSMEIADGGSVLEELRASGEIELDRSIEIIRDSLAALQYAERKDIVHRDIKPDNLMIGADGVVKLGDLGLAAPTAELQTTQTGVFGTPHYIAPEQAMGKAVDHRADIYALGATWYRVLSGRTLFSGADVREILKRQVREAHKPLTEVAPGIPAAVSKIVDRMLAKNPDERYQSSSEVLHDIDNYLLNRNASKEAIAFGRGAKGVLMGGAEGKPNWPVLIGGSVALLAAVGAALWFFVLKGEDPKPPQPDNPPVAEDGDKPDDNGGDRPDPQEIEARGFLKRAEQAREEGNLQAWEDELRRIAKDYPETEAGKKAAAELSKLKDQRAAAEQARAEKIKSLTEEANAVVESARGYVKQLKRQAIADAWPKFRAKYADDPDAIKIIDEELGDLATQVSLMGVSSSREYEARLEEIENKIAATETYGEDQIEQAILEVEAAKAELQRIHEQTDFQDWIDETQSRMDEAQRYIDNLEDWQDERDRRTRRAAAEISSQNLYGVCRSVSSAVQSGNLAQATELLDTWMTTDEGWLAHGESPEFRNVRQLVEDRAWQTETIAAARVWLVEHWETPLETIEPQDEIAKYFPNVKRFKLRSILNKSDGNSETELLYRFAKDSDFVDASLRFTQIDIKQFRVLVSFAWEVDDSGIADLPNDPELEEQALGLGMLMLEMSVAEDDYRCAELAWRLIQPIAMRHREALQGKPPAALSDELRRIKECMAYAIKVEGLRAQALGDQAKAEDYADQLRSPEYRQTRAARGN